MRNTSRWIQWAGIWAGLLFVGFWLPTGCGDKPSQEATTEKTADAAPQDTASPTDTAKTPDTAATPDTTTTPDTSTTPDKTTPPPDTSTTPDVAQPEKGSPEGPAADETAPDKAPTVQDVPAGDVEGEWCGEYRIKGNITVQQGKTLKVCAGSKLVFERNANITVLGTLLLNGTKGDEVLLEPSGDLWQGAQVTGTFQGDHFIMQKGKICIFGRDGSTVKVNFGQLLNCSTSLNLANGGVFTKSIIKGGSSLQLSDGVLQMTDTIVDLLVPKSGPDCTAINGGGLTLDHVHMTGCHCPLHINKATLPITVNNSLFDGATYPMMIANATATFRNNHFVQGSAHILDIGGGINADVANNYWEGKAPNIQTGNKSQFKGTDTFSTTPFPGIGPR